MKQFLAIVPVSEIVAALFAFGLVLWAIAFFGI